MLDVVVIGGGIAGLATAHALRHQATRHLDLCLVESASSPGGKVVSETLDGFVVDGGPDSFIVQKPWALELVRELGLEERLVAANDSQRTTHIVQQGRLVAIPEGMQLLIPRRWEPFERSPLLSDDAKLRVARERDVPPRKDNSDESVADFVRRRLGGEFLEKLGEPLLAHIHVGDIERMSLRATYPRLAEMEQRYGSLTEALNAIQQAPGASPSRPVFLTLKNGVGELVDRLVQGMEPDSLRLGCRAESVVPRSDSGSRSDGSRSDGGYRVLLSNGTQLETQTVILAVPAFAAAEIVRDLDADLARRFQAMRYVSMATLSLGYRRRGKPTPFDGFGFFVPRSELRTTLAGTWTSNKFAGRAPDEDHDLIRLFLGGALHEEILNHDDETLIRWIRQDLEEILGLSQQPILTRLYRWPRGYPQYEVGHQDRVRDLESALPPGLTIVGSPYHGVGLPDCVRSARRAARSVLERPEERTPEVDGGVLTC